MPHNSSDTAIGPAGGSAAAELKLRLEGKLCDAIARARKSALYTTGTDPTSNPALVRSAVKNVLLEVYSYAPQVIEASYIAIGRLPKSCLEIIRPLTKFILEEVDHSELALRDYIKQGGDERLARSRRSSPEAFNLAATCRSLAADEDPFCCLGFLYYLEFMGSALAPAAAEVVSALSPAEANEFIIEHARVDEGHSALLRKLIGAATDDDARRALPIEFGFDCMSLVYPLPVWDAAYRRAVDETKTRAITREDSATHDL